MRPPPTSEEPDLRGAEVAVLGPTVVRCAGRDLLFFAGTDYHRLAWHPAVRSAAQEAALKWGFNPSGSRLADDELPESRELIQELALQWRSVVTAAPTGFQAPAVAVQRIVQPISEVHLIGPVHAALEHAAAIAGRPVLRHPVDSIPDRVESGSVLMVDGVSPSTGRLPRVAELLEIAEATHSHLLIDDAHGVGVLGRSGCGCAEAYLGHPNLLVTGTLSKAFGSYGGFVISPPSQNHISDAPATIRTGSLGVTPPAAAAARASLAILRQEPDRLSRLVARARRAKQLAEFAGFPQCPGDAPILSLPGGSEERNTRLAKRLAGFGIYPSFSRYPGSPEGGHFRLSISSAHNEEEFGRLIEFLASLRTWT